MGKKTDQNRRRTLLIIHLLSAFCYSAFLIFQTNLITQLENNKLQYSLFFITIAFLEKDNYEIWRFMIDKRFQGRGYGKDALKLALDFIRTWPCGKADLCWISYEPENEIAKKLYSSFGFVETGEMDGDEIVAVLKL